MKIPINLDLLFGLQLTWPVPRVSPFQGQQLLKEETSNGFKAELNAYVAPVFGIPPSPGKTVQNGDINGRISFSSRSNGETKVEMVE